MEDKILPRKAQRVVERAELDDLFSDRHGWALLIPLEGSVIRSWSCSGC